MGWLSSDPAPAPSPYGRTWSWWKSNSKTVTVDPRKIHTAGTSVSKRALAAYKADPKRPSFEGRNDPCVVRRPDGSLHALDGQHRVLAARATGRKVTVRVADDIATAKPRWW